MMSLIIRLSSNYVNAFIFFLLDVPAVWAIHRGLLGLQGYYLYRMVRAGRRVPLARSRIPIVSGELLRGVTRFPSIFVLANVAVLLILFFGTLGVSGKTILDWEPTNLQVVSTFPTHYFATSQSWVIGPSGRRRRIPGRFPAPDERFLSTCLTRNLTYLAYWPVAYNISSDDTPSNFFYRYVKNKRLRSSN